MKWIKVVGKLRVEAKKSYLNKLWNNLICLLEKLQKIHAIEMHNQQNDVSKEIEKFKESKVYNDIVDSLIISVKKSRNVTESLSNKVREKKAI